MANVVVEQIINAPVSDVWNSWDDYANIKIFNPLLKDSFLITGSTDTGLGALRQCDFSDGKNHIREKIVGYVPGRKLVLEIYEGTVPLKSAVATFDFIEMTSDRTRIVMKMEFTPKYGIVGTLLLPIMKRQFAANLSALLAGNAAYVEHGRLANAA